jgi:tetratricopeptide (TPR) repeat protein
LHLGVGEALERLYPDRLTSHELAPILAQHFYQAGDDPRALRYLTLAGDAAARVYANAEAAQHYSRSLEIAKRTASTLSPRPRPHLAEEEPGVGAAVLLHLYTSYGQSLELTARHGEALANYLEMETLAQSRGDKALEYAAVMARAKIYATPNQWHNPAEAKTLLERALGLAHELGDRAAQSKILWNLMLLQVFAGGDTRQTVAYGEQSLAIAREFNLREQMAFTLNDLGYAYALTHQVKESLASLDEARSLWQELSNLPMLSDNLANTSIRQFDAGDYDQALASAGESFRISQSIGNRWGQASSQLVVGQIYFDRGQAEEAIASMEAAIQLGEPVGHSFALLIRADLGWLYGSLGMVERGLETAHQAHRQAAAQPLPAARLGPIAVLARLLVLNHDLTAAQAFVREGYAIYDPASLLLFSHYVLALADGELALAQQDYERALSVTDKLLADLAYAQTRPFVPEALYLKGLTSLGQGHTSEALAVLQTARAKAEALGSRRTLWPILLALSEIEARQGNHAQAEALRVEARATIAHIADHCPPELRESFLNLPRVREIGR